MREQFEIKNTDNFISFITSDDEMCIVGDESCETAIVCDHGYLILNGDHRDVYRDKSYEDCLKYFNSNLDKKSSWSDIVK